MGQEGRLREAEVVTVVLAVVTVVLAAGFGVFEEDFLLEVEFFELEKSEKEGQGSILADAEGKGIRRSVEAGSFAETSGLRGPYRFLLQKCAFRTFSGPRYTNP